MEKLSEYFYKIQDYCFISSVISFILFTGSCSTSIVDDLPWWIRIGLTSPWFDISHWFFMILTLFLWFFYLLEWNLQEDNVKTYVSARLYLIITSIISWGAISLTYLANVCGFKEIPMNQWNWPLIITLIIASIINGISASIIFSAIVMIRTKEESKKYNLPRVPVISKLALKINIPLLIVITTIMILLGTYSSLPHKFAWCYISIPPFFLISAISLYISVKKNLKGVNLLNVLGERAKTTDYLCLLANIDFTPFNKSTDAREIVKKQHGMFNLLLLPMENITCIPCNNNDKVMLSSSVNKKTTLTVGALIPNQPEANTEPKVIEVPSEFLIVETTKIEYAKKEGQENLIILIHNTIKKAMWEMEYKRNNGSIPIDELVESVAAGDVDIVKWFLDKNIDINDEGEGGWTPVLMAAAQGNKEILSILLQHGGDPNHQNLMKATALMHAALHNDIDALHLLLKYNANIDLQDYQGNTALMKAIEHGNNDAAMLLIRSGAKKNTKNIRKQTALSLAEAKKLGEVARVLRINSSNNRTKPHSRIRRNKQKRE